jgi:CheY-like chemotaxis protein
VLRRATNAAIVFDLQLGADVPDVLLDATSFESSLLNLVVNARDAMPQGGQIRISTSHAILQEQQVGNLAPGHYVRVSVSDSGAGMPAEVAARAFEPFFTTKEIGKGTGLGLSQVYGFVTQSGGDVELRTEPGRGTEISLYMPALADGRRHARRQMEPLDRRARTDESADRVLVVEDEQDVLDVTAELFRNMGYEVLTASNGAEALDVLAKSHDISLLFSDVMMPGGMSGIELAREVRRRLPRMRIMLASGYPLPALQAQHGALDEFVLLNKPYRLADIVRQLRSYG